MSCDDVPEFDDPRVYMLLESARRKGDPEAAVEQLGEKWDFNERVRSSIRRAARGDWSGEELLEAFFEAGD